MLFILSWTIHDYIGAFAGGIQRDVVTRVYEKLPPIGKVDGKRLVCVLVLENSFSSCHLCVCVLRCPDRLISRQIENRNGPAFCASNRTLVAGRVDAPIVVCNFDCPLFASFELCHEKYFILISPFRTTVCRALLQVFCVRRRCSRSAHYPCSQITIPAKTQKLEPSLGSNRGLPPVGPESRREIEGGTR
jgi:hypothetical protein